MNQKLFKLIVAVLLMPLILVSIGCGRKIEPKAAKLTFRFDDQKHYLANPRELLITDEAQVRQLVSYFPGIGKSQTSVFSNAALWQAHLVINFTMVDGGTLVVYTNFKNWNDGKGGDVSVNPGLETYVYDLFKNQRESKP